MRRLGGTLAATAAALLVAAAACNFSLDGYAGDPLEPTEASADAPATDSATDASTDASTIVDAAPDTPDLTAPCPSGGGPDMVRVGLPGGPTVCIDSTEVTNLQYSVFLDANVPVVTQPAVCAFTKTFIPSDRTAYDNNALGHYPVVYVNWCDARAFCAWAGKRLCGKLGGGASDPSDFGSTTNEFYYACSKGGEHAYPYGSTWDNNACNASSAGMIEPSGNRKTCEGGFAGVFDLVGNVGEWQNDCDGTTGMGDMCPDNSSSFEYAANGMVMADDRCDHSDPQVRSATYDDLGFRCCAD